MKNLSVKELDNMKVITQRFQLITVSRFRNRNKIKKASEEIDRIRSKIKSDGSMTATIRKWRDLRYGPSSS